MQTLILSTSPRSNSSSLRVARYLQDRFAAQTGANPTVLSMELSDFPLVGRGSLDATNLSEFQSSLIRAWEAASLVVFTVPEYNWSLPPEFLNLLHVLGGKAFARLFDGKAFAICGLSSGRGGRLPAIETQVVLGKVIAFTGGKSIISPSYLECHEVPKNVSPEGNSLGNEVFDKTTDNFVHYTLAIAEQWQPFSL